MSFHLIKNHAGGTLLTGMIAALSVGVVSAFIMQQSQVTEKQTRLPRVKAIMTSVELQVRAALFETSNYIPCGDVRAPAAPACPILDVEKIQNITAQVPGADCSQEGPCGVSVLVDSHANKRVRGRVFYHGREIALAPISFDMEYPEEFSLSGATCPSTAPLLTGFNSDGSAACSPLPSDCQAGQYVTSLDPMSLVNGNAVTCGTLPQTVSCEEHQYLNSVHWENAGSVHGTCADRKSPFLVASMGEDQTAYNYLGDPTYTVAPYPEPQFPSLGNCTCPDVAYAGGAYYTDIVGLGTQAACEHARSSEGRNPAHFKCDGAIVQTPPAPIDCYLLRPVHAGPLSDVGPIECPKLPPN